MKTPEKKQPNHATIIILITVVTLVAFFPIFSNAFINFDDPGYVTQNPHVQSGITAQTIKWAFQATAEANWHPLTWLSHALDVTLFGLSPGLHHASSLFLHLLSSLLLYLAVEAMTRSRWQSAFVALVFAVHPLHVESVAWISERKDALAGFFWMATMLAYVKYAQSSKKNYYLLTLLLFALGLMAKPMLITLPFVLLLLDYWPLGRVALFASANTTEKKKRTRSLGQAIREKIPFFALTVASSIVTFIVQQQGKTVMAIEKLSVAGRLSNAVASYGEYLRLTVLPVDLAIFYPHPEHNTNAVAIIISCIAVADISFLAWKQRAQRPYLITGWLWFLGTLVPVIGIVQVGMQAYADRYMYLPMVGLSLMVAWGMPSLMEAMSNKKQILVSLFAVCILFATWGTINQTGYWKDSRTLFEHALQVTEGNYLAHHCLGADLADSGKTDDAIIHFQKVLEIKQNYAPTHNNLGVAYAKKGNFLKAEEHWKRAVEINPGFADVYANLGKLYAMQGKGEEAIPQFEAALRNDPGHIQARLNYGNLLATVGRKEEARLQYAEALRIAPGFTPARNAMQKLGN